MWLEDDMGSPGPDTDVVSRVELGYSYELGSGRTRIRVLTRPRKGLGMVMTKPLELREAQVESPPQ